MIDEVLAPDSGKITLPFIHGGLSNRNKNGLFQSVHINLLRDIVTFREFFSLWRSSNGYRFKKLHDLMTIPTLFEEFITSYDFQHYLWDPDFVYYPNQVGNVLVAFVYVKAFFDPKFVIEFDKKVTNINMDNYTGVLYQNEEDFPSQNHYSCKFMSHKNVLYSIYFYVGI